MRVETAVVDKHLQVLCRQVKLKATEQLHSCILKKVYKDTSFIHWILPFVDQHEKIAIHLLLSSLHCLKFRVYPVSCIDQLDFIYSDPWYLTLNIFIFYDIQPDNPAEKGWKDMGMGQLSIKCSEDAKKATKESKPTIVIRNDVCSLIWSFWVCKWSLVFWFYGWTCNISLKFWNWS